MKAKALLYTAFEKESRALTFALFLLLAALFLPPLQWPRDTYTWLFFIDITQSMNVEDYELDEAPVSRLTFARQAVRRAICHAVLASAWAPLPTTGHCFCLRQSKSAATTTIC